MGLHGLLQGQIYLLPGLPPLGRPSPIASRYTGCKIVMGGGKELGKLQKTQQETPFRAAQRQEAVGNSVMRPQLLTSRIMS
jgi:hypothetical protein